MYKLMIVDDEAIIREGIINNMDFASMGVEVVASCENGVDALEMVAKTNPDIIMTDINMPFMNGMTLAEQVLETYPLTKIIFLTGYDKFEYVQQALKLKIADYLVKPVLPKELKTVFEKVINTIRNEALEDANVAKLKEQLAETIPVLRERFLNRLIKRPIATSELKGKMHNYKVMLQAQYYQAISVEAVLDEVVLQDFNRIDMSLTNILSVIMTYIESMSDSIAFRTYDDEVVIIVGGDDKEDIIETSEILAERIDHIAKKRLDMTVGVGIGKVVKQLERICESYDSAKQALEYKFFNGDGHVISYSDVSRKRGANQLSLTVQATKIHKEIKSGSLESIHSIIDEAFDELSKYAMPLENYYIHLHNILTSIILSLEEQGLHYQEIFVGAKNPGLKLHELQTLDEIHCWLKTMCSDILAYIIEEREDYQTSQAKGATDYIDVHYADVDISLKKVCKDLCMSVSYFSLVFKEETGTTFVDYLTKLRMEKAKELLRNSNNKTYEIAAAVGYKDAHYFSLVFKKNTGMTATAFRERLKGE